MSHNETPGMVSDIIYFVFSQGSEGQGQPELHGDSYLEKKKRKKKRFIEQFSEQQLLINFVIETFLQLLELRNSGKCLSGLSEVGPLITSHTSYFLSCSVMEFLICVLMLLHASKYVFTRLLLWNFALCHPMLLDKFSRFGSKPHSFLREIRLL